MGEHYNFIDFKGGLSTPDNQDFIKHWMDGRTPIIVLDACVCLDIVKFVNKNKFSTDFELQRVKNFLLYSISVNCDFLSSFGILELAIERPNFSIDSEKFESMGEKILFALSLDKEEIESQNFKFASLGKVKDELRSATIFLPMLLASYCTLLMSHIIGKSERKRENSKRKILLLVDWLVNEFGTFMMIEFHLAKKAFFNNKELWRMLWLDGNPELTKQKLFGTAWDIMHYRLNCQYAAFNKIDGRNHHPYLVTKDWRLNVLVTDLIVESFENDSYGMSTKNITTDDTEILQYIKESLRKRRNVKTDLNSTVDMIQKLESQLN